MYTPNDILLLTAPKHKPILNALCNVFLTTHSSRGLDVNICINAALKQSPDKVFLAAKPGDISGSFS